jgi:photosystem II stability/assembly factor-like uncharacterized protein
MMTDGRIAAREERRADLAAGVSTARRRVRAQEEGPGFAPRVLRRARLLGSRGIVVAALMGLGTVAWASAPPPRALLAAARCASDQGPQWTTALIARSDGTLLAGTGDGQLWQGTVGGRCWSLVTTFQPKGSIGLLYAPAAQPGILLVGSSVLMPDMAVSLQRSTDGGKTWSAASAGLPPATLPVQLAASADGTVLLSFITESPPFSAGLARSSDNGRTWRLVGPHISTVPAVTLLTGRAFALVAPSTGAHPQLVAYHSADDGRTWQQVGRPAASPPDLTLLFAVPWDPRRLTAGFGDKTYHPIALSSADGGTSFGRATALPIPPRAFGYVCGFAALSATHTLLLSGLQALYRSTDNGSTWQVVRSAALAGRTIWTLLAAPDGRSVYAGTDKGLFASPDTGRTWSGLQS